MSTQRGGGRAVGIASESTVSGDAVESGRRRAALLIHALTPEDREWLLSKLEDGQRRALEALVAELVSLGIPADRGLVEEATRAAGAVVAERGGSGSVDMVDADPSVLVALLGDEPALLLAQLLLAGEWRWGPAFLAMLDRAKRGDVESELARRREHSPEGTGLKEGVPGAAFRRHLVEAVGSRVGAWSGTPTEVQRWSKCRVLRLLAWRRGRC